MAFTVSFDPARTRAALKAYPTQLRTQVLDGATHDAANELARLGRGYIHSRSGALVRSIAVRQGPSRPGRISWLVEAGAYYAGWVELGHGAARRGRSYGRGRGRRRSTGTGRRTPPHPFLTRASRRDRQRILAIFRQSATRRLNART
jgi:hypothetical protein